MRVDNLEFRRLGVVAPAGHETGLQLFNDGGAGVFGRGWVVGQRKSHEVWGLLQEAGFELGGQVFVGGGGHGGGHEERATSLCGWLCGGGGGQTRKRLDEGRKGGLLPLNGHGGVGGEGAEQDAYDDCVAATRHLFVRACSYGGVGRREKACEWLNLPAKMAAGPLIGACRP